MDTRYSIVPDKNPGYELNNLVVSTDELDDEPPPSITSFQSPYWRLNASDGAAYASARTGPSDGFYDTDESKQPLKPANGLTGVQPQSQLPPIDIAFGTRLQCLITMAAGIACSLICIICGIAFWDRRPYSHPGVPLVRLRDGFPSEIIPFIGNIILTQCLEGLAYIHSISLRWSLLKEEQLVYNTNTRLLTSSKLSRPNSWYINSISAALLILCYGATSTLVMPSVSTIQGTYDGAFVNLVSLLALGIAILGQSGLAIWCYYDTLRDIPTWNSNPLNTTVTMIDRQTVRHREGRCMNSVQIRDQPETGQSLPRTKQPSPWQVSRSARRATKLIWTLTALSFVWFLVIVLVARNNMEGALREIPPTADTNPAFSKWHFSFAWYPSENTFIVKQYYTTYFNTVFFSLDPSQQKGAGVSMSLVAALIAGLLFISAIQGLQTLMLHSSELVVNLSRDEDSWRALDAQRSSSGKTNVLANPPFLAALKSWKYLMLVIFKSLLHFLLGQSLQPSFSESIYFSMNYVRLLVFAICVTAFAAAMTFLAFAKPKGPQPATYGHIQTIADLVDDWTLDADGRFWWGDKGGSGGLRHAGMSSCRDDLGTIQMNAPYAGETRRRYMRA